MERASKYSLEVRERAVRLVLTTTGTAVDRPFYNAMRERRKPTGRGE